MGNAVGDGRERERVGLQIHLALSVADRERRPFPRSDQQILLALEQVDERKGASQALERCVHSLLRRLAGRFRTSGFRSTGKPTSLSPSSPCPKRAQHVAYGVADIFVPVRCREHELLVGGQRG